MLLNFKQFADLCGFTRQWVTKWADRGMPVVSRPDDAGHGNEATVDTTAAIPWLIEEARKGVRHEPGSARDRLAAEQAERVAMENAERRGELVPVGTLGEVLNDLAATLAADLEALPGRMAAELAGMTDPGQIRQRLQHECRAVRSRCSERLEGLGGMAAEGRGVFEDRGVNSGPTAGPDA